MSIKPWPKLIINKGIPTFVWICTVKDGEKDREKERSISLYKRRYLMSIKPWPTLIINKGIPTFVWICTVKDGEKDREKERSFSLYKKQY